MYTKREVCRSVDSHGQVDQKSSKEALLAATLYHSHMDKTLGRKMELHLWPLEFGCWNFCLQHWNEPSGELQACLKPRHSSMPWSTPATINPNHTEQWEGVGWGGVMGREEQKKNKIIFLTSCLKYAEMFLYLKPPLSNSKVGIVDFFLNKKKGLSN